MSDYFRDADARCTHLLLNGSCGVNCAPVSVPWNWICVPSTTPGVHQTPGQNHAVAAILKRHL